MKDINKCEKSDKWKRIINKMKNKYGLNLLQFEKQLGSKYSLNWEHEKDYIDWDWAMTNMNKKADRYIIN